MPKVLVLLDRDLAYEPRLKFRAVALWSSDTDLTFHAPREDGYVSQSAINLYGTAPDFSAPARSIASLMAELGHAHLDLLKISAEGAEYEILDHMLASDIDVRVLLRRVRPTRTQRCGVGLGPCARASGIPPGRHQHTSVELEADLRATSGV